MLFALHSVDFGVLLLYFGSILAIGSYFRRDHHTSRDFFLAGRSMDWLPIGLSIVVTLLSGWTYSEMPGEAYWAGLQLLLIPLAIWLTVPLVLWYILPMYRGLELYSVYEYLELRFDSTVRLSGSLVSIVLRLLWVATVLGAPYKLLTVAANVEIPWWVLIAVAGLVTTFSCFLGGMKALMWSDVVRTFVMLAAVLAIIGGAWWGLKDGPRRVWDVATTLNRSSVIDTTFNWNSHWTVWGIVPHYFVLILSLYVADQITVQRYLVARTIRDAKWSFLLNCILVSIMIACLAYAGLCLLAFYHDHPQALRIKWTANVNGETLQSLTFADRDRLLGESTNAAGNARPLLDWNDPRDLVTTESVEQLVAERRLLHPNRRTPWENANELFDSENPQRLDVEKLATRRPPKAGLKQGEVVLNAKATDELLPWFVATQLPFGITGLVLAGVFAATMSSLNSGIHSICTLLLVDFYRRCGWGRKWLARRANKPENELTEADELLLGRPMTLVVGVVVTLFAIAIAGSSNNVRILLDVLSSLGAPLLGIFLLGFFTRRGTASGAVLALGCGILFTMWLIIANTHDGFAWMWPLNRKLNSIWLITFGTLFTCTFGYVTSNFYGRRKDAKELRGLVLGCGELGRIQKSEVRG